MEDAVRVRGVTRSFGEVTALDDVTFSLSGPGLVGILGPNGAGKTTLLDLLEGLDAPDAGEILLFGRAPTPYPRRRVGVVMQREFVMEHVSVGEYAELFAAIYGVSDGRARILEEAALSGRAGVSMARISGGEAARLFLAAAVVHEPELIFLDEPTAPLDPAHKLSFGRSLRAMAEERLVVMTTHDLREAEAVCDHLVFLVGGRLRACGPKAELAAAVPEAERRSFGVEDAFFHFCAVRMRDGEIARDDEGEAR